MDTNTAKDLLGPPPGQDANNAAPAAPTPSLNPISGLTPQTSEALGATKAIPSNDNGLTEPSLPLNLRENYRKANQQGDIPLDIDSGTDAWTRLNMALRRAQDDKINYLEGKYGKGSVRLSSSGEPIYRVLDSKTGKPKDVQAREEGTSLDDFVDLAGQMPEIAAGIWSAKSGKLRLTTQGKGLLPALETVFRMGAGQEGVGAIKDLGTRAIDKEPLRPGEVAEERGKMMLGDVVVGSTMGAAGKVLPKLASPFANPDTIQFDMKAAQKYFLDKGFALPGTPGELSGNSFLMRAETMARMQPGSAGPFEKLVAEQNKLLSKIQNIARGLPPEATEAEIAARPTAEQTGNQSMEAIGKKVEPIKKDVETGREKLAQTGTDEITAKTALATGQYPMNVGDVGKQLRETALSKRAAFQAQSSADYSKVYDHPEAGKYILSADSLSDRAKKLLSSLPAPETITEKPTGIVDKFGNEILRDEAGQKIMRNFVPPNVLTKLNDLAALKDGKFRLGDLLKMRTEVANDIAQGEAIPGMNTHYLGQIRDMLTDTIKDELGKLDSPELKNLWETANSNYAKGVKPFQQAGISEIYKEPEQSSFLGNNQLVERAMDGTKGADYFSAYKNFYGEASPEFQGVKRAIADRVLGSSTSTTTGFVDAQSFLKKLGALNPSVANDVFGAQAKPIINAAKAMAVYEESGVTSSMSKRLSGTVKQADLEALMKSGEATPKAMQDLLAKEKALGAVYRNDVLKKIGTGEFTGDKIKPAEFVNYFANSPNVKVSDIHQVISLLNDRPDVLQNIKSELVQDVLNRSTVKQSLSAGDIMRGMPGELSPKGIIESLGDKTQQERYRAIMGDETFRDLQEIAKYLSPKEKAFQSFRAAGGLSAGAQIAALERGDIFKFVDRSVKNFVIATVYTSPALRKFAAGAYGFQQGITPESTSAIANYMIQSTPFVEAVYNKFGDKAQQKMGEIKASIDRYAHSGDAPAKSDDQRKEEFQKLLQSQ